MRKELMREAFWVSASYEDMTIRSRETVFIIAIRLGAQIWP